MKQSGSSHSVPQRIDGAGKVTKKGMTNNLNYNSKIPNWGEEPVGIGQNPFARARRPVKVFAAVAPKKMKRIKKSSKKNSSREKDKNKETDDGWSSKQFRI